MDARYLMKMRSIKFGASLFASSAALALSNALPVQSFPQWVTIEGAEEGDDLIYDYNSLKALPNGIKGTSKNPVMHTNWLMRLIC